MRQSLLFPQVEPDAYHRASNAFKFVLGKLGYLKRSFVDGMLTNTAEQRNITGIWIFLLPKIVNVDRA